MGGPHMSRYEPATPTDRHPVYASGLHNDGEVVPGVANPPLPGGRKAAAKPRRRWIGFLAGMALVGAVFGGAIIGLMRFVNGSVEGTTTASGLNQVKASVAPKPAPPNRLGGVAIEFDYPPVFNLVASLKNDATAIEQYTISSKNDYRRTIAVSVHPLASALIDDDSSYKFRLINPATYTMTPGKVNTEPVMLAKKTDGQELTLFYVHGQAIAAVAITSSIPGDDLAGYMTTVQNSLRWRR